METNNPKPPVTKEGAKETLYRKRYRVYFPNGYQEVPEEKVSEYTSKGLMFCVDFVPLEATPPPTKGEGSEWIPVSVTPDPAKFYQLAFNDDVYLQVYQWHLLDLSNRPTPCFISCVGNDIMEAHEVSHYREFKTDPPDWPNLNSLPTPPNQ